MLIQLYSAQPQLVSVITNVIVTLDITGGTSIATQMGVGAIP